MRTLWAPIASIALVLVAMLTDILEKTPSNRGIQLPVTRFHRSHFCGVIDSIIYLQSAGKPQRVTVNGFGSMLIVADADLPFGAVRPFIEASGPGVQLATRAR